ncbi:TonB family protein, partial [bacterium]|nr:TonB family protein [bacterium]
SVNKNWVIPSSKEKTFIEKVKITVVVQKNGKLMFMETIKSSGSASFNQAALEALALSAPFPELPPNFSAGTLQMDFIFDYVQVHD